MDTRSVDCRPVFFSNADEDGSDLVRKLIHEHVKETSPARLMLFIVSPEEVESLESCVQDLPTENVRCAFVVVDREDRGIAADRPSVIAVRTGSISAVELCFLVDRALLSLSRMSTASSGSPDFLDAHRDLQELIKIGKSLSVEKDFDKLLRTILYLSKKITGADAGSIFLVGESESGAKLLRFKYSHTFSKDLSYEEFTMPCDTSSIAGYVAVTGKVLNLPDAYHIPGDTPYSFNTDFRTAFSVT